MTTSIEDKDTQEKMRAEMLEQGLTSEDIDIVIDFLKRAEERDRQAGKVIRGFRLLSQRS